MDLHRVICFSDAVVVDDTRFFGIEFIVEVNFDDTLGFFESVRYFPGKIRCVIFFYGDVLKNITKRYNVLLLILIF